MESSDPPRRPFPDRKRTHVPKLEAVNAFEQQEVSSRRRIDERSVPRRGARRREREDLAVRLDFATRFAQELRARTSCFL